MEKTSDSYFNIGELRILKSCNEDILRKFIKKISEEFFIGRIGEDEKYMHFVIYDKQFFKDHNFVSPVDTSRMDFKNIEEGELWERQITLK